MRIANVMLGAGAGGLETVGFQYARLLAESGHDVWMICHRKSPYAQGAAVKFVRMANASVSNPLAHLRLALALRRIRPDVVFCHGHRAAQFYTPFLRFLVCVLTSAHRPRFVAVCHGSNGWRCRKFPRTIAVSSGVCDELVEKWHLDPDRVVTIPNAVPVPTAPTKPVDASRPVTFGFLGRFDYCKGLDILLRAMAAMRETQLRDAALPRLVIGGSGSEEPTLRRLADELHLTSQIQWLGWVSDKSDFFSRIDVLVMPSREEGLPISLLEAMAHRKAVIVSDCPGPASLVSPEAGSRSGFVVPKEDVSALASAMARMMTDVVSRDKFAAAGYALVEARYSEKSLLRGLEQVIASPECES